eukprot:3815560-Amphidinium_carterae.1
MGTVGVAVPGVPKHSSSAWKLKQETLSASVHIQQLPPHSCTATKLLVESTQSARLRQDANEMQESGRVRTVLIASLSSSCCQFPGVERLLCDCSLCPI